MNNNNNNVSEMEADNKIVNLLKRNANEIRSGQEIVVDRESGQECWRLIIRPHFTNDNAYETIFFAFHLMAV